MRSAQIEAAARIVAGYHAEYPLQDAELSVILDLIMAGTLSVSRYRQPRARAQPMSPISLSEANSLLGILLENSRQLIFVASRQASSPGLCRA